MTQAGEDKELVLGNGQLMSLFFVVVALCGVFFAMGYMIGRNTSKTAVTSDGASSTVPAASGVATGARQQPEPPRETGGVTADAAPSPATEPLTATAVETRPAQEPAAAAPARTEPTAAETKGVSTPEIGASYLQVTALPRADADGVVRTLREQSFPVILAASSKDGLFRVLVGPYHQTAQLADAKSRLKAIGFGSAFVQKQ